jgi:hypothetical protein
MKKISVFMYLMVLLFSASTLTVEAYGGIGGGPIIGSDGECNGLSGSINCVINIVRGGGGACINCKTNDTQPAPVTSEEVIEEVIDEEGEVLGATCIPLLTSYMHERFANPVLEVMKLQMFLNRELGVTDQVTGNFGPKTTERVNAFQLKYAKDVLAPWVPLGLVSEDTPTGYVYKTTLWKINSLACPALADSKPVLP